MIPPMIGAADRRSHARLSAGGVDDDGRRRAQSSQRSCELLPAKIKSLARKAGTSLGARGHAAIAGFSWKAVQLLKGPAKLGGFSLDAGGEFSWCVPARQHT